MYNREDNQLDRNEDNELDNEDDFEFEYEWYLQDCKKTTDLGLYQDHYFAINKIHVFFSNW